MVLSCAISIAEFSQVLFLCGKFLSYPDDLIQIISGLEKQLGSVEFTSKLEISKFVNLRLYKCKQSS